MSITDIYLIWDNLLEGHHQSRQLFLSTAKAALLTAFGGSSLAGWAKAQTSSPTGAGRLEPPSSRTLGKISVDAYIYGYPLITSEITRQAFTDVTAPSPKTLQAPMGQVVSQPAYPPADYKGVTAPNADTLYTVGFIDVGSEPWIFSYPDMHGRYFLFPIYSLWTEVLASPGKRTLGTGAQTIAITGTGWNGTLPSGVTQLVKGAHRHRLYHRARLCRWQCKGFSG